ncbi:hypothetical protein DICVIV_03935 [Dictyocaulus viviparus]|uniref:Pentatricopeptide repeat domain protein n=1 Tax=Dictyocaulus viviparus TaxID=29172 RepID=A0A0D8Y5R1_DICVI|nr:hypothetical protein DICVIV_03935 [Dictyocaulus viviparus]
MMRIQARAIGLSIRICSTEAAHSSNVTRVVIPPAIKRGPIDMLTALSETVGVDTTAPHFGFIDDPAMIPSTAAAKKNYYLAKARAFCHHTFEMGKRAARSLAEEWPTLFAFDRDDPYLPAFRPQKPADPLQVLPSEENLLSMIDKREVQDAVMLYERLRSEKVEISQATQMELFKLVTYYNGRNVPFSEWEMWHGLRICGEDEPNKWTMDGIAELLFASLPCTPETVSIYIAGLIKFATPESISKAKNLQQEFSSATLFCEAYEALISISSWDESQVLLKEMVEKKLMPSINTWISVFLAAKKIDNVSQRLTAFEKAVGEMTAVGVAPSLCCYQIIFSGFLDYLSSSELKEKGKEYNAILGTGMSWILEVLEELENLPLIEPSSTQDHLFFLNAMALIYWGTGMSWILEVLEELENLPLIEPSSTQDHLFFLNAMALIYCAGNLEIAERLVKLYESPINKVKMPALTAEGLFYNRYLLLFIEQTTSMEEVEKKYKELVPRLVGVSRQLTMVIADKLKKLPHWSLLLRLIEDGICARQTVDFRVSQIFRDLLIGVNYQTLSVEHREEYAAIINRLVSIWTEFSRFTDEKHKRMQLKFSPSVISDCAVLLNRIGDSTKAYELLEMLLNPESSEGEEATVLSTGYARPSAMLELFEDALRERHLFKAATCLEIMSNSMTRNKLESLVQKIQDRCQLTEDQSRILTGFVRLRPQ